MQVFTGDSSTTTNTTPDKIELKLKDVKSPTADEIQKQIIDESPKAYTAAAAKLTHKPRRQIVRKLRGIINKIRKNAFKRPDLTHLKQELESIDLSTNTFVKTTSHLIPLNDKIHHPTLGIRVKPHPDIKDALELVDFQRGTSAHRYIRSWKRRLKGTIITTIDGTPINKLDDIINAVRTAKQQHQKQVKVEFGSLVGFAMSGDGIPTLQTDQMNVIAHHIHSICTKHDLWSDKTAWSDAINSSKMIEHDVKISKLQ